MLFYSAIFYFDVIIKVVINMAMYGSNEELIKLLNIYNDKEYSNDKFMEWLDFYPDILNIALDNTYNHFFDDAIRNNIRELLKRVLETNKGYLIYQLLHKYNKEIFENIDVVLDEDEDYRERFYFLASKEGFGECVLKNQDKILSKALSFIDYKQPSDSAFNLLFLLRALPFFECEYANKNKDLIENFIITNFNIIDPQIYDKDLTCLFESLVMSSNKHKFIKEFIDNNSELIATLFANKRMSTLKREEILDFYTELIKDVVRIEKASIVDMTLKKGEHSATLIIKDKVIKSGDKRVKKIPRHKRILQPILRQTIKYIKNKNSVLDFDLAYVEAYERTEDLDCSTDESKIQSKELVYFVFKEMLEDGILWTDPQVANLGILLKPNLPFHEPTGYNDDKFYIDDETIDFCDPLNNREILDEGELIVRDVDLTYEFKNIKEFIENKVINYEKVTSLSLRELKGMGKTIWGPEFEKYMNRYIEEVKSKIQNNKKN